MRRRKWLLLAAGLAIGAVLSLGCASGDGGELKQGVLTDSLATISKLQNYEVQASGQLRQGGKSADVALTYQFVGPDRLRFLSESTSEGITEQAGLIIIGDLSWSLENGIWKEEPSQVVDINTFSAARIWGPIPFDTARLQDEPEHVDGVEALHYHFDKSATLSFETLAGALLAAGEPQFSGDLTHVAIEYWTDASGGWPVRMKLAAKGSDGAVELTVDLTKANDSSIQVAPP